MDLAYPAELQTSLDALTVTLGQISVQDEVTACGREPALWDTEPGPELATAELTSPLAQVAEMRELGQHTLSLGQLLRRTERRYVPLPRKWSRGGVTPLGWPNAMAPWAPDEPLAVEFDGGKVRGRVSVAPFCVPANRMVLLARQEDQVVLVKAASENSRAEIVGDGFQVTFEDTPAILLAQGTEATDAWKKVSEWERLALVGLTLGVIDRTWRIALDGLCEGKRQGHLLADEQAAQFQLSDNHIDRLAADRLALDVAIDAEHGSPFEAKLSLVRYFTTRQAEQCAARALHLASLFMPRMVPLARWMSQRAHQLSLFGVAREHEVRAASAGLVAGLSLE